MRQPLVISKPFIRTFSPLTRSAFTSKCKVRKRGTFSEVLGVSSSAELDSGRCPKNPPTFEKVGSKLLYLRQPRFVRFRFFLVAGHKAPPYRTERISARRYVRLLGLKNIARTDGFSLPMRAMFSSVRFCRQGF